MKGPEFEGMPERWMTYIGVDDVDARLQKAEAAGATICKDAFDIPRVGRMAVLQEPGGAFVAWMTPETRTDRVSVAEWGRLASNPLQATYIGVRTTAKATL